MRLTDTEHGVDDPVLAAALRLAGELTAESLDRAVSVWTRSPLQELAHLHVLAASGDGVDPDTVGRPRRDPGVGERLQALAHLVTGGTSVPAPLLAAVVYGEIAALRPFGTADALVGRAAFRLVCVSTGLDPHALGVPEVYWYRDVGRHRRALAGFTSGEPEGVGGWVVHCCEALQAGAREAGSIAEAVGG